MGIIALFIYSILLAIWYSIFFSHTLPSIVPEGFWTILGVQRRLIGVRTRWAGLSVHLQKSTSSSYLVQKYKKFGFYKTVLLDQSRIFAGFRVLDDRII